MLYLGSLKGLNEEQRSALVERIECLLLHRYDSGGSMDEIESLAVSFVGKYYSRESGHSESGERLLHSGGDVRWAEEEERIILASHRSLRVREIGGEWLCWQAIAELGIRTFLEGKCGWSHEEADVLLMNLLGRLLYPVSEHKTVHWLEEQSGGPDLLDHGVKTGEDALHRMNVRLLGIHHELEAYLYERMDSLLDFSGLRFLYDMTNTYFEGRMSGSTLARFGRSKEKRSDCPLVSMGLLCNEQGFRKRSDFYPGNISEPGTFDTVLDEVEQSGGVMTDAGIGTTANIERAAQRNVPYMCVTPQRFNRHSFDFTHAEAFTHQPSNDTKPYRVWVYLEENTFEVDGQQYHDRLIFVKSEAKEASKNSSMQRRKQRMEQGLESIRSSLSKPRGSKSLPQVQQRIGRLKEKYKSLSKAFDIRVQAGDDGIVSAIDWTYDPSLEQRNGVYVIRTSMPVASAREAWQTYHLMTRIEAVNRCCKTDLNIRPVYHQKDHTIKAHLLLSLLACSVAHYILFQLARKGIHCRWKEVVRIMNTQKTVFSEFKNNQREYILFSQWSVPEKKAAEIYSAMNYTQQRSPGFFFKVKIDDS
jgi:transposase